MIRAVLFDVDGVLVDSFEANLRFFQRLMEKAGYAPPTREQYKNVFAMNLIEAIKTLTQSESEDEIKRIWVIGKNREVPYDSDLLIIPKGAEKVIKNLSKNFSLGIVTSRVKENIYESPTLTQLVQYFDVAVGYEDTTKHKPHPEPLLLAAKRLKVMPEECIYVGDAPSDLQAGRAASMKVVIYSKNENSQADAWTTSFDDLPTLIHFLSS